MKVEGEKARDTRMPVPTMPRAQVASEPFRAPTSWEAGAAPGGEARASAPAGRDGSRSVGGGSAPGAAGVRRV